MNKFFLSLYSCLLLTIFISCTNKKYYYKQDGKEEKVIEASSDSDAYMQAFQSFEIAKKVHNDMKKSISNLYTEAPISFELLNNKHEDITYKVFFANKDSLEKACADRINDLPNNVEESMTRIREEKNGVGAKYDTGGLYLAPVKVLTARFVTKEYSNYKDVSLSYKNVSGKKIAAIRFKWYGENSFNEPADMTGITPGWGAGFTDEGLRVNATGYGTWDVFSKDGKKILIAYPYEVAFEDGTKWELNP